MYMCVWICVYMFVYMRIYCVYFRYVYIHAYVYICVCVYMCTCIWVCMYECIVYVYLGVYEYMCDCLCLYVCVYTYIHTHTYISLDAVRPLRMIMPPARAIDYKTSVPDMRNLLSSYLIGTELLLSELSKRLPKQHKLYCPWKHPEVGGKSLLLETPCTLDPELRGPTLELTWKPPP